MSELKPNYKSKKMSIDDAIQSSMDNTSWKAYLELHEISITRRDD